MRLYLDEDTASALLIRALRNAGHEVQSPADVGRTSDSDVNQLRHALREQRVLLTLNYKDFEDLHLLVQEGGGAHAGILVVRRDNDPRNNMAPRDTVRAIRKLEASGLPVVNEYHVLNHWR
jgi:hypothetical protein